MDAWNVQLACDKMLWNKSWLSRRDRELIWSVSGEEEEAIANHDERVDSRLILSLTSVGGGIERGKLYTHSFSLSIEKVQFTTTGGGWWQAVEETSLVRTMMTDNCLQIPPDYNRMW